ncbi:MAG TPA: tetratricopeptide repeat protein [Kofleriaceae bacterium]|jgi:tetratricopeptide (TPR) repeat protein
MAAKKQDVDTDTDDEAPKSGFDPKAVNIGGESIADRLMPHIKKILSMVVIVAAIVSAVFFMRWRKAVKEENKTAQLVEVMDTARTQIDPTPEAAKPGSPPPDPSFKTPKDRADAVLAAMAKSGADGGPLYKAGALYEAGNYDEAITTYQTCTNTLGLDGVLCREGLGLAQEQKALAEKDNAAKQKGLEAALATFASMQPDETGDRYAYALYHQGRVQQTLGKTAEAKALLEKAKTSAAADPGSQDPRMGMYALPSLIERRLAQM